MFVDRQEELATLEKEFLRKEASFVVVYGRRRVGKTTLLSKFIEDKQAFFYLATEESETQNLSAFREVVAEVLQDDLLRRASVNRWDDLFARATDASSSKPDQRTVIVIDEFQYLCKANKAFPSILQRIWDSMLSKRNVMLVLCGSLVSMMVSQTLSYSSPLYGRRTAQVHMRQIPFRYYCEFFPKASQRELVELYSVTGGIPKYIELFDGQTDLCKSISDAILSPGGFLYDEPNFLLQKEVGEIGSYFSIIKAIAAGNSKPSKIAALLEVKQTALSRYLSTLIDLDIVEREVPATEIRPEKSKKGLYRIKDNYLRFWFRYAYPYRSFLESGHLSIAEKAIERDFVAGHVAHVYESVCREKVWSLAACGQWPFVPDTVGRWWDSNDNEIDVVAANAVENAIVFGECKFWKGSVGCNVLGELEEKAKKVVWGDSSRSVSYVLFSIDGFTEDLQEVAAERGDVLLIEGAS